MWYDLNFSVVYKLRTAGTQAPASCRHFFCFLRFSAYESLDCKLLYPNFIFMIQWNSDMYSENHIQVIVIFLWLPAWITPLNCPTFNFVQTWKESEALKDVCLVVDLNHYWLSLTLSWFPSGSWKSHPEARSSRCNAWTCKLNVSIIAT